MSTEFSASEVLALLNTRVDRANAIRPTSYGEKPPMEDVDRYDDAHSSETWVYRHLQQPPVSTEEQVVLQISDAPRTEPTPGM